jgi:hypothetical protein
MKQTAYLRRLSDFLPIAIKDIAADIANPHSLNGTSPRGLVSLATSWLIP